MKIISSIISSIMLATISTAVVLATTAISLMFTSKAGSGKRTALFDAIYFASHSLPDDGLSVSLGISNWISVTVICLTFAIFYFLVILLYRKLKHYKQTLVKNTDGTKKNDL